MGHQPGDCRWPERKKLKSINLTMTMIQNPLNGYFFMFKAKSTLNSTAIEVILDRGKVESKINAMHIWSKNTEKQKSGIHANVFNHYHRIKML